MSRGGRLIALLFVMLLDGAAHADDLLHRYEGDVLPYDPSAGWLNGFCDLPCREALEQGYFILRWPEPADLAAYTYLIAQPPTPSPTSLWAEWRFRSNHPLPRHSYTCDAEFSIRFKKASDLVSLYGNAVISFSGDEFVWRLPNNEFRTYRFESPDGVNYWFSVDGLIFRASYGMNDNGYSYLQFRGRGGCLDDWIPNMENAWDFVRFGTIGYGERIVSSDPPAGFVDARAHPSLDRCTIRYDSANYVYLDEITVEVTEGIAPIPIATRRLDNGPPDVVEILLDRPIPYHATTRFTFNDGTLSQSVEFTYAPGDANGDGRADLSDFFYFQTCFGVPSPSGPCLALDADANGAIELTDFAEFHDHFTSSNP